VRRFIMLLFVLILVGVLAIPASAQSPLQQATGTGVLTRLEATPPQQVGRNQIEVRTIEGVVFGDLEGDWTQEVRGVTHPNGQVTFQGTWEFTGKVADCGEGTISGRLNGRGAVGDPPDFPATTAQVRVTNQPSNTVGAVGQGVITQKGFLISYDIQYRCK
jgi:hypothetical protein